MRTVLFKVKKTKTVQMFDDNQHEMDKNHRDKNVFKTLLESSRVCL